ncbi:MAG: PRC-barrel domain-containing protein [Chthoniobacterales bacterium]
MSPAASSSMNDMANGESQFVLGSKIMGCHVKSQQGEDLGTISNIVVNTNTGHIRYAVLSTGSKKVTVPWNALNPAPHATNGQAPHFVLNSSKQKLANAPKFNPNDLSNLSNRTMEEPIFTYYDIIWFPDTLTSEEVNSRSGQEGGNSSASPSPSTTPMTESTYGTSPTATASPSPSVSPR